MFFKRKDSYPHAELNWLVRQYNPLLSSIQNIYGKDANKVVEYKMGNLPVYMYGNYERELLEYAMSLPTNPQERKNTPIFSGVLKYFPDAIAEIARVSKLGNEQHNPGEPLHWAREKSTDQLDSSLRHQMDYANGVKRDTDGGHHLAKACWRLLAELQLDLENEKRV